MKYFFFHFVLEFKKCLYRFSTEVMLYAVKKDRSRAREKEEMEEAITQFSHPAYYKLHIFYAFSILGCAKLFVCRRNRIAAADSIPGLNSYFQASTPYKDCSDTVII